MERGGLQREEFISSLCLPYPAPCLYTINRWSRLKDIVSLFKSREELALGILVRVCQKLSGGSKGHKKKTKGKAKTKGGGTKGQKTAAKKLRKLSKHYGKLKYDANPKLAF